MSKYTIEDVKGIIPIEQTKSTREAIERYLNEGVIPGADPCTSCEPNHIRKLISVIQVAERNGLFPPKRETAQKDVDWAEGSRAAGTMSRDELEDIQEKRAAAAEDADIEQE